MKQSSSNFAFARLSSAYYIESAVLGVSSHVTGNVTNHLARHSCMEAFAEMNIQNS